MMHKQAKRTIWALACLSAIGALSMSSYATGQQGAPLNGTQNVSSSVPIGRQLVQQDSAKNTTRTRRALGGRLEQAESGVSMPAKILLSSSRASSSRASMGDSIGLETALRAHDDLTPAAGEHKKYVLVKKKPKHKKIKMEVYQPKMKYKKIKIKVPVKKLKKKKVKGYLVKKEMHHHHY